MKPAARRSIAQAVFETLEARVCLSATINLQDGVLLMQAETNTASRMQVAFLPDHTYVRAYTTGQTRTYRRDQIHQLVIVGSSQDDMIWVDPRLGLPASIVGGAGNDVIQGGSGLDTIRGGSGNDVISGHGFLYAGPGNTVIRASRRHNVLVGGSGNDLLIAGAGDDAIFGGSGHSTLVGGSGHDTLYAQTGDNVLYAGHGHNTLVGGTGRDTLYGGAGHGSLERGSADNELHAGVHDTVGQAPADPVNSPDPTALPQFKHHKSPPRKTPTPPKPKPALTPAPKPPPSTGPVVVSPGNGPGGGSGGGTTTSATKAVITQFEQSITAGEGVEVNAFNSTLATGTPLTARYHWNFGDPTGRYNDLTGWNAGHIYDHAGRYTITLQITDASGQASTASSFVMVGSDNRHVIYVDNEGSDVNDGSTPLDAVQTAAKAFQLAGNNSKVEFRRGQTFQVNQTLALNGHDMYVGAYGTGANPVLMRDDGDGPVTLFVTPAATNAVITGLTFDSPHPAINGVGDELNSCGVWAQSTNVVVRGCTFLNLEDAVDGEAQPHGIIVQDNVAPLVTGLRGYFCWVDGTDWTIVGNTVANSTRQHVVRGNSMAIKGVLIADNDFAKVVRAEDPAEVMKTTINFRAGSYVYVADNILRYGSVSFNTDEVAPDGVDVSWIALEGNWISGQIDVKANVHHIAIRNNVLDVSGTSQIYVGATDTQHADRHVTDLTITQNTGLNDSYGGQFLEAAGTILPGAIRLTNNLYAAPHLLTGANMAAGVLVDSPTLDGFALISGNVWPAASGADHNAPGAVNYAAGWWFADTGWLSPDQWNAQPNVHGELFQKTVLPSNAYTINTPFGTAGAAGFIPQLGNS